MEHVQELNPGWDSLLSGREESKILQFKTFQVNITVTVTRT